MFLVALLSYSPELNPVERLWLHLRARFSSLGSFDGQDDLLLGSVDILP
jgi:transposase